MNNSPWHRSCDNLYKLEKQSIFIIESHFQRKMLAQKTFIKKTRRGNIIKVVREHYLRYLSVQFSNSTLDNISQG